MFKRQINRTITGPLARRAISSFARDRLLITKSNSSVGFRRLVASQYNVYSPSFNQKMPTGRRWYGLSVDQPAEEYKYEDVKKLAQQQQQQQAENTSDVLLVDVREPQEYAQGAIPSAVNIPYNSYPGALGLDPEDFYDTFGFSKPSLDQKLVFYCLAGVRSAAAEQLAATYGYQKRGNYTGSYQDWIEHESPEEQQQK